MRHTKTILIIVSCLILSATHAQSLGSKLGGLIGKSAKLKPEMLPESYEFNWLFKTIIKDGKGNESNMDFMFMDGDVEYYGMEMSNEQLKNQGQMFVVTDRGREISTMFMIKGAGNTGENMAQMVSMPEEVLQADGKIDGGDYTFNELPPKVILNYNCKGIQMENEDYVMTMYYATDAPVSFFKVFGDDKKSVPKGFDPRMLDQLKDGLVMEMICTNKKKDKFSFTLTAQSLESKEMSIHRKDFQFMNGFMGLGSKN